MEIFVVEDDPIGAALLETILEAADREIRSFMTCDQVLAALEERSEKPDLVVTDIQTPPGRSTGIEVAQKCAMLAIPVILVTGSLSSKERARKLGFPVFMKPFSLKDVKEEVDRLLGGA